jgi:hypothetical protein
MSDLSWVRVERGLWARLDGTATTTIDVGHRRRWLWIAAPSLVVAAVIAIVFGFVVETPKTKLPTVAPVAEETPTRIVSSDSPSTITYGDVHVTLDADSAVVMPAKASSTAVLERGAAWFAVAPRKHREFVVVAGDTVVRVIGTRFRVARSEEHATVEVERGLVDVTFQGTTRKIGTGQRWSSELPAKVATSEADVEPIEVEPLEDDEPPKPKHTKVKSKKPSDSKPAIDPEREKFEKAQSLEASDRKTALALYLDVAKGKSQWAENSLYAAARLSADFKEKRAKVLIDMYLTRYPQGTNAKDARMLRERMKGQQ